MIKVGKRPLVAAAAALTAVGAMAFVSAAPAGATTAPAPECISFSLSPTGELCVPQNWMTVTSNITNDGLLTFDAVQFYNTSSSTSNISQTETVTGTLTAGVTGNIKFGGNGISPEGQASVSVSVSVQGQASIPPDCMGNLYFGIHYIMDKVQVYSRNIYGQVTSSPQVAWAPTTVGYSDGYTLPVPDPNGPNAQCVQAAATQPVVPNVLQFVEGVLAGPSVLAQPPTG